MVGKWELSSSSWIISDCQWLKGRLLHSTAEIPPNLPRSEAAKVPLLSPSLQSLPLCLTHSFVCNLQDWICVWMLCRFLRGYGGLFSLHCSCYFSNYIDIKLFFSAPPVHWHGAKGKKKSLGFTGLTCFSSLISSPPEAIEHPYVQACTW